MEMAPETPRAFKTRWFSKAAAKARIGDDELCNAFAEALRGQIVDLGGGVFKKRLDRNRHRSILLARGGRHWFFTYLFAKKDRDNIDVDELAAFKDLADLYAVKTDDALQTELAVKELVEICHDDKNEIQK